MVATVNASTSAGVVITPDNSGVLALQSSSTTALTVDASQNVGIGTSSPASKLEVSGSGTLELARFATTTDNTPSIGIYSNGSIRGKLRASSAETALLSQGALPLLLGTNDTERARIDSSGNFMVGTTSSFSGGNVLGIMAQASGLPALGLNRTTSNGPIVRFYFASTEVGSIVVTGSTTSYGTSSDYRLKNAIAPMTGALAKVGLLKPVTYKWNLDNSESQGFIAHELQAVVPECVTGEKDAVETYTDEDGNEATRPVYQGIDTSFLVATLTAAIQELHALVKTQDSTITALTTRITALEGAA